jgi:hypothetical protein
MLAHIQSGADGSTPTGNFCPHPSPKIEKREAVGCGKGEEANLKRRREKKRTKKSA